MIPPLPPPLPWLVAPPLPFAPPPSSYRPQVVPPPLPQQRTDFYVSPSQIDKYLTCKRSWGWRYLAGIEAPPHRSAQVGTRVHGILELWLSRGIPPTWDERLVIDGQEYFPGRIATEGLPLLPPPGPHLNIERRFRAGHWLGQKDVEYLSTDAEPVVMDHKTTSSFSWAKTPSDLETDPQAIIYAYDALFHEHKHAKAAHLAWTYMTTSKPYKAKRVHLRVTREYVGDLIRPYNSIANEMLAHRIARTPAEILPPTPTACQKYGGCPYLSRCKLSSEELMQGHMTMQSELMAKINASKTAALSGGVSVPPVLPAPAMATPPALPNLPGVPTLPAPALPVVAAATPTAPALPVAAAPALPVAAPLPPAPPPALPAPPPPTWLPHPQSDAHEFNPATNEVRERVVAAPPAPPPPVNAWLPHPQDPTYEYNPATAELRKITASSAAPAFSLNPPEAPAAEKAEPSPIPVGVASGDESKVGDQFDTMTPAQLKGLATQHGIDVKSLREKNLRIKVRAFFATGEGTKVVPVVFALPGAPPALPTAPSIAAATAVAELEDAAPGKKDRRPNFTLLVNTAPAKTNSIVMNLGEAFGASFRAVAQTHGVTDWRLVPHGDALVSDAVRTQCLEDGGLDRTIIMLRTGTPEGNLLFDVLLEHAFEVYGS